MEPEIPPGLGEWKPETLPNLGEWKILGRLGNGAHGFVDLIEREYPGLDGKMAKVRLAQKRERLLPGRRPVAEGLWQYLASLPASERDCFVLPIRRFVGKGSYSHIDYSPKPASACGTKYEYLPMDIEFWEMPYAGDNLHSVWPTLTQEQRDKAIFGMFKIAQILHKGRFVNYDLHWDNVSWSGDGVRLFDFGTISKVACEHSLKTWENWTDLGWLLLVGVDFASAIRPEGYDPILALGRSLRRKAVTKLYAGCFAPKHRKRAVLHLTKAMDHIKSDVRLEVYHHLIEVLWLMVDPADFYSHNDLRAEPVDLDERIACSRRLLRAWFKVYARAKGKK